MCGSCWAFGSASVIESRVNRLFAKHYKQPLFQMSEQAIVDCLWSKGNMEEMTGLHGCDGGFANEVMERIIDQYDGKLAPLASYPYMSQDMACQQDKWNYDAARMVSFSNPASTGELKYALLDGPVTVAIGVTPKMTFYSGGIFNDAECVDNDPDFLNHQVVVTGWGYDQDTNQEYWIIRNSWSNAWGVDGYIYIAFGSCGVTLEATVPNFELNQQ